LLQTHLEAVTLPLGERLVSPGMTIEFVYFLGAGLGSDIAMAGEGERPVECGMIGREGLVGLPIVLDTDRGVHASEIQVAGHGLRIPSADLRRAMEKSASLGAVLLCYSHYFLSHTAQTAACNARHSLSERLSRRLLMAHDRLQGDILPLTHDYLSIMLGVRRASVTQATHVLEGMRVIKAVRGQITVLDREGLEGTSCACYRIIRGEVDRVIAPMIRCEAV
jgi:CRP-like cAMP-binding protein